MTILSLRDSLKKFNLKNGIMNEFEIRRIHKYPLTSHIKSDQGIVNIDDDSMAGSHWTCFIVKDNKSYFLTASEAVPINFYKTN